MKKVIYMCTLLLFAGVAGAQTMGNTASWISDKLVNEKQGNAFLQAVSKRQTSVVKNMVKESGAKSLLVNYKDKDGNTPLMIASQKGYFDLVKFLAENGAYVNTINNANYTALCFAVKNNRVQTVAYLLKLNAHVNHECGVDERKKSPLLLAASNGSVPNIIKALVAAGADVNYTSPNYITPLMRVAEHGDVQLVDLLVKKGADINAQVPAYKGEGMPVAFFPIWTGQLPALKYLLEHGARLNGYYGDGAYITPLDIGEVNGGPEMAAYLKSKGFAAYGYADWSWE